MCTGSNCILFTYANVRVIKGTLSSLVLDTTTEHQKMNVQTVAVVYPRAYATLLSAAALVAKAAREKVVCLLVYASGLSRNDLRLVQSATVTGDIVCHSKGTFWAIPRPTGRTTVPTHGSGSRCLRPNSWVQVK